MATNPEGNILLSMLNAPGATAQEKAQNSIISSAHNSLSSPQEKLLTPDMKKNLVVVNDARPSQKGGISELLSRPEVQYALMEFGRAVSGGYKNTPGTILANAGENLLQSQANQRAYQAYQNGGDVAKAGGTFASPQVLSQLSTMSERKNEFNKQYQLQLAQSNLNKQKVNNDFALQSFAAMNNANLTNERIKTLQQQESLAPQLQTARIDYMKASGAASETGANASFISAGDNYLKLVQSQIPLDQANINQIKQAEPDKPGFFSNIIDPQAEQNYQSQHDQWQQELNQANAQLELHKLEEQNISKALSTRAAPGAKFPTAENVSNKSPIVTKPTPVNSISEINNFKPGKYFNFLGNLFKRTDSGYVSSPQPNSKPKVLDKLPATGQPGELVKVKGKKYYYTVDGWIDMSL